MPDKVPLMLQRTMPRKRSVFPCERQVGVADTMFGLLSKVRVLLLVGLGFELLLCSLCSFLLMSQFVFMLPLYSYT